MAEREVLEAIFQNAAGMTPGHLKPQLAYRHMIALADSYDGWAQDQRMSPERSARLLGWADGMRRLAHEVGLLDLPTFTGQFRSDALQRPLQVSDRRLGVPQDRSLRNTGCLLHRSPALVAVRAHSTVSRMAT